MFWCEEVRSCAYSHRLRLDFCFEGLPSLTTMSCFFLLCNPQDTVNALFSVKLFFLTSFSNVTLIVLVTHSPISAFACLLSHLVVSDSVIPWTAAHQAPLPMEFCRQERILEWAVISFSRGIFLTQGLNPCLLQLLQW